MKNSKKGFTLVEVLASAIILALITVSIVFTLTFSQNIVQRDSTKDAYAAEVQAAADVIMTYVNNNYTTGTDIESASSSDGQIYLDKSNSRFDSDENNIQFKIESTSESPSLYKIKVCLFYGPFDNRNSVEMVCFSHAGW